MKKYLFTTLPSNDLGLLTRSLPIACELRNRGNEIAFCNPAKAPNKLITEAKFENILPTQPLYYITSGNFNFKSLSILLHSQHLKRDIGFFFSLIRHMFQSSTAEIWNIDHFMYLFGMWNEGFIQAIVDAIREVINTYKPDVIVDFWNPFACIAARTSGKPLITVIQADMHPESQGFIWWKQAPADLFPSPISATNVALAEYHLPPINKIGELLLGDMTLVLGLPETDPLPESANVTYIGPILWQQQDEKLPDWIDNLGKEHPLIWLYPGNMQYMRGSSTPFDSAVVLQACITALGNEAVDVLLGTGHQSLPHRFSHLPPNFFHASYVPGLAMAEKSDLLIHHGGYGSCQTGLYAGKPALIIPTYSERESNARRIAAQEAGDYILPISDRTGRKKHVSAEEVRAKVFNILKNKSFKENAIRISKRMKNYGGATETARRIDNFV